MQIAQSHLRSLQKTADAWGKAYLRVTRESIQMGCGGQVFVTTDEGAGHWSGKPCVTIGTCEEYSEPVLVDKVCVSPD